MTLGNLGYYYRTSGDLKHALKLFNQRLVIAREIAQQLFEQFGNVQLAQRARQLVDFLQKIGL